MAKVYGKIKNLATGQVFSDLKEAAASVGSSRQSLETTCARARNRANPLNIAYKGYLWEVEYFGKHQPNVFAENLEDAFKKTHGCIETRIIQTAAKVRVSPFVAAIALNAYNIRKVSELHKERMFAVSRAIRDGNGAA